MTEHDPDRFKQLPEPVRPEQMLASHDAQPVHDEIDDAWRENQWFLKVSGI